MVTVQRTFSVPLPPGQNMRYNPVRTYLQVVDLHPHHAIEQTGLVNRLYAGDALAEAEAVN